MATRLPNGEAMIKYKAQLISAFAILLLCACNAPISDNKNQLANLPAPNRSAGCGINKIGSGSFVDLNLRIGTQNRIYHMLVPNTYDPNHVYPIIFRWHGSGGNGLSGGLGIEYSSNNDAIVVGADGLNANWDISDNSADLIFFDRMLESISKEYCIDRDRVFSYGFSMGGFFTNLLACERGDVVRASAAIAGGLAGSNCTDKVASWYLHDLNDTTIPIAEGRAERDRRLTLNGCSAYFIDVGNACVRYQGCDTTPVIWCESSGIGHNIQANFAPPLVWDFFKNLN